MNYQYGSQNILLLVRRSGPEVLRRTNTKRHWSNVAVYAERRSPIGRLSGILTGLRGRGQPTFPGGDRRAGLLEIKGIGIFIEHLSLVFIITRLGICVFARRLIINVSVLSRVVNKLE